MQVQVDIGFNQLVQIAKGLPATQWKKLKQEVETPRLVNKKQESLKQLLLNGPTATKKQLETITNNRKAINQWRTKL